MFKPQKTSKKIRIRFYNTLVLPSVNTVVKITIRARDGRIITATEMKCVRRTEGYTWTDFETNTEIATEINITPVLKKKHRNTKKKNLQHIHRMPCNRLPRKMQNYRLKGRRNQDRSLDF